MNLIDRDALADALGIAANCSCCKYQDGVLCKKAYDFVSACEAIYEQPIIEERKWIPCSERLPKPFEHCLWTTTDGRVVYHHCDGLFSNYTAWMPLPEPYAERRTDE